MKTQAMRAYANDIDYLAHRDKKKVFADNLADLIKEFEDLKARPKEETEPEAETVLKIIGQVKGLTCDLICQRFNGCYDRELRPNRPLECAGLKERDFCNYYTREGSKAHCANPRNKAWLPKDRIIPLNVCLTCNKRRQWSLNQKSKTFREMGKAPGFDEKKYSNPFPFKDNEGVWHVGEK